MNPAFVQGIAIDTLKLILVVSAPILIVSLIVGLTVSILQATTQVNEMTLAYIPKIVAIYAAIIIFSGFILDKLMNFTSGIFSDFSRYVK